MKTAVIYARFSCAKQREASIEDQLRVCHDWCEHEGYVVVHEYCDYAVSGRTDDRPQFQEMIHNAGESDIVLVYMLDRFSRDTYDAVVYKRKLRDKGVKVISATEAMPDGPEAILIESVYEALAQMESIHTSKRVRRGMEGNALQCKHNGACLYGYDFGTDGCYVINEDEARVVREVFSRKATGEPVNAIATDLARRGIKVIKGKKRKARPVSYGFVYNMLKNEKYTGVYIWGDVRVEGGMPAIVTKKEFAMAQAAKPKKQRATEAWGEFMLSGKAICEGCGMNLVGTSGHGRHGTKYEYYKCSKGCGLKPIRADWLEQSIAEALRELLSNREEALRIASIIAEHAKDEDAERKIEQAKKRKDEAEKGIDRLMDAIANGLDLELAKGKIDELKTQMEVAAAEIRMQENTKAFDAETFADFLQFGTTLDDTMLLKAFVYQVLVGDDDVTVTLNYDVNKNEPARLNLSRVRIDSKWWTGRGSNPGPWD